MNGLALRGVDVRFARAGEPDAAVLQAVDLEVPAGRRLALVGANGSGKTTLLRTLSGALRPDRGQVVRREEGAETVLGYDRRALTRHRRAVQLVIQNPDDQLFSADVWADVSFGPTNLGWEPDEVRRRTAEALALLEISDLTDRPLHQLSYGQRKRVAIAGAVAMRPAYLLLDEPTAGLDPAGTEALLATLASVEGHGTTVVFSTHDLALAWEWADAVGVLAGHGVRVGGSAQVLSDGERLRASGLRMPWQAEVLTRSGAVIEEPRPRSAAEVVRALEGARDPNSLATRPH